MGLEDIDLRLESSNSNCGDCKIRERVCLDQSVVDTLNKKQKRLGEFEKKVLFLQALEPNPLSADFRGDVTLVGSDEEPVYAHRFILAGKSLVFRKMLDIDTNGKEKGNEIVRVDGASSPVLRLVVNYCYTAEIRFTEDAPAEKVLEVAHKFGIAGLKGVCESELSTSINKENFCNRLVLAHMCEARDLNGAVAKYFRATFEESYTILAERLCKSLAGSSPIVTELKTECEPHP
ncbi:hypothetical protein R1sor_000586 [Riccia sorocarpa]|uniref:BTB domain-containing protein n=1 Tax=Riccia sorocarpa TaxID=122646 RepID=A0ABD3GZI9_9MARC